MGNQLAIVAPVRVEDISPDLRCVKSLGTEEKDHFFFTFHCLQPQSSFEDEIKRNLFCSGCVKASSPTCSGGSVASSNEFIHDNLERNGSSDPPFLPPPLWYTEQRQWHRVQHLLQRIYVVLAGFGPSEKEFNGKILLRSGTQKDEPFINTLDYSQYLLYLFKKARLLLKQRCQELEKEQKNCDLENWSKRKALVDHCEGMLHYLYKHSLSARLLSPSSVSSIPLFNEATTTSNTGKEFISHSADQKLCFTDDEEARKTSRTVEVVLKVFSHPGSCSEREMIKLFRMMQNISGQLRIVEEVRWSKASSLPPATFLFYTFPLLEEEVASCSTTFFPSAFLKEEEKALIASPTALEEPYPASISSQRGERGITDNPSPSSSLPYRVMRRFPSQHIYLKRPYIRTSLPERLSTRPYLSLIERFFVAFQLLKAVETLHDVFGMTHGDLKPSNVMMQSSGWVVLVDLAPYKPALIPVDELALFEYFYDTQENRLCYAAPEKFVMTSSVGEGVHGEDIHRVRQSRPPHVKEGDHEGMVSAVNKGNEDHLKNTASASAPSASVHSVHPRISSSTQSASTNGSISPASPATLTATSALHMNAGMDSSSSFPNKEVDPALPSTTGFSLNNINIDGHTATMDMFSLGAVLVYVFMEESPFLLSDVLALRRLYPLDTPEKQVEREDFIKRILQQKQRIQDLFQPSSPRSRAPQVTLPKANGKNVGDRDVKGGELETGECGSAYFPFSGTAEEKGCLFKSHFLEDFPRQFTLSSCMGAIQEMLVVLLASLPQYRPSCSDLLRIYTPRIFPVFFNYLYESVFPLLLVKTPDDQLQFFSDEIPNVFATCVELEVKELSSPYDRWAKRPHTAHLLPLLRISVSYQVVSILLPPFLVALRGAGTQQGIFLGLSCLHDLLLSYIPCLIQVKTILPHLLFIIRRPEEYDARCRLLAWRSAYKISRSYIIVLRKHTPRGNLASTFSRVSPSLIKKFTAVDKVDALYVKVLDHMISNDPYLQPNELMESGMMFETLILPALKFCVCERALSTSLLQDEIVILEVAEMASSFVSMAQICLEWQHNYVYALEGKECNRHDDSTRTPSGTNSSTTFQSHSFMREFFLSDLPSLSVPGFPSSSSPSVKGIPFEKRKEEALLTLWQMYLARFQEVREKGWEIFRCIMEYHSNEVGEMALSCLPEWIQVLGTTMTQTHILPLLMRKVKSLSSGKTVRSSITSFDEKGGDHIPSAERKRKKSIFVQEVTPHAAEAEEFMLFRQCILSFSLPELVDAEWNHISCETVVDVANTVGPKSRLEEGKAARSVQDNMNFFTYLEFFVSSGLWDVENKALLSIVLDALSLFLRRVSSSTFSTSSHPKEGHKSTSSSNVSSLPWGKEAISRLVEIVLYAVPLLAHTDTSVSFSAAGVVVQAAKALACTPSFALSLCRAVRPFLTEPVPILLLQSSSVFPYTLCRSPSLSTLAASSSHPFFSHFFNAMRTKFSSSSVVRSESRSAGTSVALEPKESLPCPSPEYLFDAASRLAYVFRGVPSTPEMTTNRFPLQDVLPCGAPSARIGSLQVGVHMPLISLSFACLSTQNQKEKNQPQPRPQIEEEKNFPYFHLHLPIASSEVKVQQAVWLPIRTSPTAPQVIPEQRVTKFVTDGSDPHPSKSYATPVGGGCLPGRREKKKKRLELNQEELLSTLRPSGVPLLSYSAEQDAAFYALVGVGHRLFFAAGSKGFAGLFRWKVEGDEEQEDDEDAYGKPSDGSSRNPGRRRNTFCHAAGVYSPSSTWLSNTPGELSQFSANRYRSHHFLEVVHRFPWCGREEEEVRNRKRRFHTHSNALSSQKAFQGGFSKSYLTYTTAQSMHARPADPLSSIISSSPACVAVGTSLGDVSILDVERGTAVYTCDGDPERGSELQETKRQKRKTKEEPLDSFSSSTSLDGVTSLLLLQSNVLCATTSTGSVGLIDIRVPGTAQKGYSSLVTAPSSGSLVWSSRIPFSTLGVPTSSCGLYHGQHVYGAVIGTSVGVCQLIDFRFQRSVQNYWFHPLSGESSGTIQSDRMPAENNSVVGAKRARMEMVWSSTSWRSRMPRWGIQQLCLDPLGSSTSLLSDENRSSSAPWIFVVSSAGPVYRFHLSTGRYYEALRPWMSHTGCAAPLQKLWVGGVSTTTTATGTRVDGAIEEEHPLNVPSAECLRVFSGGEDGHVRQWDLNDVMISTASTIHTCRNGVPSLGVSCNWLPSPHSFTFQRPPFYSSPYFIRSPPLSFFTPRQEIPEGVHWRRKTLDTLLSSTIVERNDLFCSGRVSPMARKDAAECNASSLGSAEIDVPILERSPPPIHQDAVTALTVVSGNEYQAPFSSLCLMSASRDGVLQIWRNKTHTEV